MNLFDDYDTGPFYDEMFEAAGVPRPSTRVLAEQIASLPPGELKRRQAAAEKALFDMGITFSVYGHQSGTEKIWPFDLVPRIIPAAEWDVIDRGLKQRIYALNKFINDVYHDQAILNDKVVPRELVLESQGYLEACRGLKPPRGIWCHITGTDLVRDADGQIYVLEDNLRSPSGVSYVLANRRLMKRTFFEMFAASNVKPVDVYPTRLLDMLHAIAPNSRKPPLVALLTPGTYNSAYFEHSFLAHETGIELVEGSDLVIDDGYVCMKTTRGLQQVDVIYRRINDDFLDPQVFRPDSVLGVRGLIDAYRKGRVALANAPGTGVADDKGIYPYVPDMIKYYLGEEPILPNVPTYMCTRDSDLQHVLQNLDKLVVKSANEAGGYGMLVGPASTTAQQEEFAEKIRANPRNFIAQPTLGLSRVPVIVDDTLEGRHVDLRPYILYGDDIYVLPGGLTRVALVKGSLVVNSSQGGGSKDTWVLEG
ncbi:MAG: circularly permuted type 2 ATP-grasp protein [Anaerolineae bacterium]